MATGRPEAGKLVVVTGAASGIGAAVVARLAADGFHVLGVDTAEPAADLVELMVGHRRVSVAAEDEMVALGHELAEGDHPVHGLVNAAGVLTGDPAVTTTAADWRRMFEVNAYGVFLASRAVLGAMVVQEERDPGNRRGIVTLASNAGVVPRAGMAAYGASKAAATHFTRALGLEAAAHGVRCNVVSPGTTRTPMVDGLWEGRDLSEAVVRGEPEAFKTGIPLGRIADPEDIAGVVAFLLGPDARHLTLHEMVVDGGAAQR